MFIKALFPDTLRALQLVSKVPAVRQAYLAGGTALALHIGHRISVDLDFFTDKDFLEDELERELTLLGGYRGEKKAWRTVMGKISQTKFSMFYYKYPLIGQVEEFDGIRVASKKDIAAMKIHAIEERGTRRDFVDVYFLAKDFSLEEMLGFYEEKYGCLEEHKYSILRSLDYFEDAEMETALPEMLVKISWDEVKKFFRRETVRLAKASLGL